MKEFVAPRRMLASKLLRCSKLSLLGNGEAYAFKYAHETQYMIIYSKFIPKYIKSLKEMTIMLR